MNMPTFILEGIKIACHDMLVIIAGDGSNNSDNNEKKLEAKCPSAIFQSEKQWRFEGCICCF